MPDKKKPQTPMNTEATKKNDRKESSDPKKDQQSFKGDKHDSRNAEADHDSSKKMGDSRKPQSGSSFKAK